MIKEEEVLALYNSAGARTASRAKPRMVSLSVGGDQGNNFGNYNNEKYFFVERVWFAGANTNKAARQIDFCLNLYVRPNEVSVSAPNAFISVMPPAHLDLAGYTIESMSIDPYVFARQAQYQSGGSGASFVCRLLIWEIEE